MSENDENNKYENKLYVQKYNKTYYERNKVKLLEDAVKRIRCNICNIDCSKSNISKHIKTEKHKLHVKLSK